MITRTPATAADITEFFGMTPRESMRAIVLRKDGEIRGLVGIALARGHARFFADFREEFRPDLSRVPVWRAVKAAMWFVEAYRGPVLALADAKEPDSERLLQRLGFEHHDTQDDGEIYVWPSSQR